MKPDVLEIKSEVKKSFISNVHKVVVHEGNVFVVHGSLRAFARSSVQANENQDAMLDILNVSEPSKSVISSSLSATKVSIHEILEGLKADGSIDNEDGLIQDAIFMSDQAIAMAAISYDNMEAISAVKFHSNRLILSDDKEEKESSEMSAIHAPLPQSWISDYPIIAYKSYSCNNNEIVIGNLARDTEAVNIVNLDNWRFLCFLSIPSMIQKQSLGPIHSYIIMLVKHKVLNKVRLMGIEIDPWLPSSSTHRRFNAFIFNTNDFKIPQNVAFEDVRRTEWLVGQDLQKQPNYVLLMQLESDIYYVSLNKKSKTDASDLNRGMLTNNTFQGVFDQTDEKMLPRYMIRPFSESAHVYCAVVQNSTHKVMKIELIAEHSGVVQAKEVYVLITGLIAGLEIDPENDKYFYLIDDF